MFCHSLGSERATTATTGILETLILSLSKDERSSQAQNCIRTAGSSFDKLRTSGLAS